MTPGFQDRNQGLTEATDCPMIEAVLANLALVSGYDELAKKTRLAPLGHSAWSDWPYFIAHAFPERTACGISLKGSWPHMKQGRFFNDGFAAGIKGIPLLLVSGEWEGNIGNGIAKTQPLAEAWGLDFRIICDWGSGHFEYSKSLPAFLGAFVRDAVKGGKTADACGGAWPMQGHGGKFAVLGFKDAEGKLIAQNPKHHLQITLPTALVAEDPNELRVAVAFDEIVPPGRPECWTHQIAGSPAVYPAEGKVDWHLVQGPGLKTGDGTFRLAFNRHGFDGIVLASS